METSILPPHPPLLLLSAACGMKSVKKNPKGKLKGKKQELLGDESEKTKSVPRSSTENRSRILQTRGGAVSSGDWLMLKIGASIHQVLQRDGTQDVTLSLQTSLTFHTHSREVRPLHTVYADTTQGKDVQETSGCLRIRGRVHCLFGCHGTTSTQLNFTHNPLSRDPSMG